MRIGKGFGMSILEILAFITALTGVVLGVFGNRITWPWWGAGSLLYAYLFFQSEYYASAALQFVFIAGGIWGWFGWGPKGAIPRKSSTRERIILIGVLIISSLALWPVLVNIGASSTVIESFGFVGSVIAQLFMIWQRFEAWPLWVIVNIAYTYQYFVGQLYLTSFLYVVFLFVAIWGWIRWRRESEKYKVD
jgi:nicotinamide mononucleotide transporter